MSISYEILINTVSGYAATLQRLSLLLSIKIITDLTEIGLDGFLRRGRGQVELLGAQLFATYDN